MKGLFSQRPSRAARALALTLCLGFLLPACGYQQPTPPPLRAVEPENMREARISKAYSVAAVRYAHSGEGLDWSKAGLLPVLIILKNKSDRAIVMNATDVKGQGSGGDFLPYPPSQASVVVTNSSIFSESVNAAGKGVGIGAIIGGGLGALLGLISGNPDAVWRGALAGGVVGGATGGVANTVQTRDELRQAVDRDLRSFAWDNAPVPPGSTKQGYIYLPAGQGITNLSFPIRTAYDDRLVDKVTLFMEAPPLPMDTREPANLSY